jgi:hypothetical protein
MHLSPKKVAHCIIVEPYVQTLFPIKIFKLSFHFCKKSHQLNISISRQPLLEPQVISLVLIERTHHRNDSRLLVVSTDYLMSSPFGEVIGIGTFYVKDAFSRKWELTPQLRSQLGISMLYVTVALQRPRLEQQTVVYLLFFLL